MDAAPLRNRSVLALLAAEVVSTTGAQMTWIALPWFVLTLRLLNRRARLGAEDHRSGAARALFASGFGNGLINPSPHSITTLRIPDALRASVMSSLRSLHMIAMPIGILGVGPLLDAFGVEPVFALAAGVQTVVMAGLGLAALREHAAESRRPAVGMDCVETGRRLHTAPSASAACPCSPRCGPWCRRRVGDRPVVSEQ